MQFFISYIKERRVGIAVFILFSLIFFCAFGLYRLPIQAVLYPALLCILFGILFAGWDMRKAYAKHKKLQGILKLSAPMMEHVFPAAVSIDDKDYQEIIRLLCQEQAELTNGMNHKFADMVDYYTVWAHQIKTPIASMRLRLQNEDSSLSRKLSADLFRIEQYVEMVLMFLRLGSDSTDYVIKECDLDSLIKQGVKKFAGEFIGRRLKLEYEPLDAKVITDEKWLSFVIEQLLSNALKYTPQGSITIGMEEPKILCIRDTGIGIAPEDLPRIFEKGYTGYNGREDKKASGIGLYLCRRICNNLGHTIKARSSLDTGTVIEIDLSQRKLEIE